MMVFCLDCKWYDGTKAGDCSLIKGYKHTYLRKQVPIFESMPAFEKNKEGTCPDYKRLWWLFWHSK